MLNAIILAGDYYSSYMKNVENKAFIRIRNKAMIEYVVEALEDSDIIDKIAIVGPKESLEVYFANRVDYYIQGKEDLMNNILESLKVFEGDNKVLIVASDIPALTSEAINHFAFECLRTNADLYYPIVKKEDNQLKFPHAKRTYARLKEGVFTGGNIICVNPLIIDRCISFSRQMIKFRKKPWKMCKVLGWDLVLGLVIGSLTIPGLETRVSNLLNIKATAILSPYAEISNDVDKESDFISVTEYFENIS